MKAQYKTMQEEVNLKQMKGILTKLKQESGWVKMKKLFIIVALVVMATTGCAIDANDINNVRDVGNTISALTDIKADVYRVSCNTVRSQLNAPSSAKFPSYSSGFVTEESSDISTYDTMYIVKSYVEAENKVGGTGRCEFGCRVYANKDSNSYDVYIDYLEE